MESIATGLPLVSFTKERDWSQANNNMGTTGLTFAILSLFYTKFDIYRSGKLPSPYAH